MCAQGVNSPFYNKNNASVYFGSGKTRLDWSFGSSYTENCSGGNSLNNPDTKPQRAQANEAWISWIYKTSKQTQKTFLFVWLYLYLFLQRVDFLARDGVMGAFHECFFFFHLASRTSSPWLHFITLVLNPPFQMCHLSLLHANGHDPTTSTRHIGLLYHFSPLFFLFTTQLLALFFQYES